MSDYVIYIMCIAFLYFIYLAGTSRPKRTVRIPTLPFRVEEWDFHIQSGRDKKAMSPPGPDWWLVDFRVVPAEETISLEDGTTVKSCIERYTVLYARKK